MQDLTDRSIGRYHITQRLGEGGMAIVYKAFDTRLECDVAVKFIRTEKLAGENSKTVLKRFKIEAQKTAALMHPNIVPVIDYGEFEGMPYLVMKYLPGGTLKQALVQRLKKNLGAFPYPQAAALLAPVARALEVAHQSDLVHRDVKPSNILLTPSGQPMLTDFGVAKILESNETMDHTALGIGIGTPEYMAPEQWEGITLDGRADVYALGVVFYELITGRVPFKADTIPAVMVKVIRDPLPRPRTFVKDIPEGVEKVIFKALAKRPEHRYNTMGDFALALEKLASQPTSSTWEESSFDFSEPVVETQPDFMEVERTAEETSSLAGGETSGSPPRRPWPWVGAALVVIALIGGFLWWQNPGTGDGPPSQQTQTASAAGVTPALTATSQATPQNLVSVPGLQDAVSVLYEQEFSNNSLPSWLINSNSSIEDGVLQVDGQGEWNGLVRIPPDYLHDGQGILMSFQCSRDAHTEIYLEAGQWGTKGYKRWGIYCHASEPNMVTLNSYYDVDGYVEGALGGNLKFQPDTWYNLLLVIGGSDRYVVDIWAQDQPDQYLTLSRKMDSSWNSRDWIFRVNANAGSVVIDHYQEIEVDGAP
jgi:serine/threonine protein kinase